MFLKDDSFEIEIKVIDEFTEESVKNSGYDFIHNPVNFGFDGDFLRYYEISIKSRNKFLKIALIGEYYIYTKDCAVFENGTLTLLLNNKIAGIDAQTGELIFFKSFDIYGLGDHIYKVSGKYIIKGEQEIVCLDEDFDKVWCFGTRDIFECTDDKAPFTLCEDRIKLYDFLNDYFELDFDGKVIKEELNSNPDI